ncbi:MAG: hypothetical protein VW475_08750 [Curvibacter sp.]
MKTAIEATIAMEDALFRARCYAEAMDACAGDDRPSWLFAFLDQLNALDAAMEPLSLAVRSEEDIQ